MADRFDDFEEDQQSDVTASPKSGGLFWWVAVGALFVLAGWMWYTAAPTYVSWYMNVGQGSTSAEGVEANGRIPGRKPGELAVVFFSVGDGDGILLQAPDNFTTLIDGGEGSTPTGSEIPPYDWGYQLYLPFFQATGIDTIDAMINTVPVSHHMGAQPDIIAHPSVEVKQLYLTQFGATNYSYRRLKAEAQENDVPVNTLKPHQELDLGAGVKAKVVHSDPDAIIPPDASHVLFIQYGEIRFLLMSDLPMDPAEKPGGESQLVLNYADNLEADVLKVGGQHKYEEPETTSQELLQYVNPRYAVISTDRNSPRPFDSVLKRLEAAGVRDVLRTDQDGHIAFYTDGSEIRVETGKFPFLN